jgi:peptide/nickel transport system substrate-binding protein
VAPVRPLLRLLSILLVAALLAACSSGGEDVERSDDGSTSSSPSSESTDGGGGGGEGEGEGEAAVLRLGLSGPLSLDPAAVSPASVSAMILVDLVHDSLTRLDAAGKPQPELASFTGNEDRTVWRFELGPDATFADGSAITADDVVASIDRIRSLGGSSLAAIQLDDVESVTAVGPTTVDFGLATPSAELPAILSSPVYGILDRDAVPTGVDGPGNPSGDHAVELTAPDRLTLQRRRGDGPTTVELRLFPDDVRAYEAFRQGALDWSPVPVDRLGDAIDRIGLEGLVPFHATVLLGVSTRVPPLDQPALRRAVALAIDRSTLTDAVFGPTAQPLRGLVPAGVRGAAEDCVDPCGPDLDQARQLLAQAFPDGQIPSLRLLTDETATHGSIAGVLEEQLGAVGIGLEMNTVEAATYGDLLASGQQQLFLYSSLGVSRTPATHLLPWASTSPDNVAGYANELVDVAIAAVMAERSFDARTTRWREIEAGVLGDVPVVPLAQLRTVAAVHPRIDGLIVHADGAIALHRVSFDGAAGGRGAGGGGGGGG